MAKYKIEKEVYPAGSHMFKVYKKFLWFWVCKSEGVNLQTEEVARNFIKNGCQSHETKLIGYE